jgi:Phage tail tube protein
MALDASRTIDGTYGYVYHNGQWLTNIRQCQLNVEIEKEEIKRAGTRWTAHKVVGLSGKGTISGYKVTSDMVRLIGQVANDSARSYVTELIVKLADPEAYGYERIRVKGVVFDNIPLMNFEVGQIVEEELNFTFTGYEFLDAIKAPGK